MGHGSTKLTFRRRDGVVVPLTIDNDLKATLDEAKRRNSKKWDYVALCCGLPGAGKSTFVKNNAAPYLCPWFSVKYICFSADEFIEITTKCPEYSVVDLDEAFATLNTKIMYDPEFLRVINHLQLIRKRKLYIFINLPNYFDLSKTIALFRASHLFVPYEDAQGNRGYFEAFDREAKRMLYVKGQKFMDYNAHPGNYTGRFFKNSLIIDEKVYEDKKDEHIKEQDAKFKRRSYSKYDRDEIIYLLGEKHKLKHEDIAEAFKLTRSGVTKIITSYKNKLNEGRRPD